MKKRSAEEPTVSMPSFETLEEFVRSQVQELMQRVLDEEVTVFLQRKKSERRSAVDPTPGSRNGYGKPRRLSMTSGTIVVRRPRVRDTDQHFESRVLPLFVRRTKEVGQILPELYLHGLSKGDFELALRGLLGDGAPLSASSIERLRAKWQLEYDAWNARELHGREVVYAWVDGIYVKAGLEKEKAALLVVIGAMSDGTKEVLAVTPGFRESTESWAAVFRSLRDRGLSAPKLLVGDGAAGAWAAKGEVWPETSEQRCWNHKIINVLDQLPKKLHAEAKQVLCEIPYAPTRADADKKRDAFVRRYRRWAAKAVDILTDDWERMVTFYDYPVEHWKHLRTTNIVESPFASVRLRTGASKRFKKTENATAMIWRVLRVAEKNFRKLDGAERLAEVYLGKEFVDGKPMKNEKTKVAA